MRHSRATEEVEHHFADFIFAHDHTIEMVDITIYTDQPRVYVTVLPTGIGQCRWADEQIDRLAKAFCDKLLPEGFTVVFAWPSAESLTINGDYKTLAIAKAPILSTTV